MVASNSSKKPQGLGKSLIKSRFQATQRQQGARMKINPDGSMVKHTAEIDDSTASWTKMQSITQENDLDAFLTNATLAGTDFTAEKLNVQVISTSTNPASQNVNPYLLTPDEEKSTLENHAAHASELRIPKRPMWDGVVSASVQQQRERDAFLNWRRGLVVLEEEKGLLMTPYERNIEVWRQLWRVCERSDMIIQIVDARNPLLFRCADIETYVSSIDPLKKTLLLINKADMLTRSQREEWASYLKASGISYLFFSAALARRALEEEEKEAKEKEMRQERVRREKEVAGELRLLGLGSSGVRRNGFAGLAVEGEEDEDEPMERHTDDAEESDDENEDQDEGSSEDEDSESDESKNKNAEKSIIECSDAWLRGTTYAALMEEPVDIRIHSCDDLLARIHAECPAPLPSSNNNSNKVTIGFVGYPNVGKSSTLNALAGAKKVTVSATPGKTKHFQTIHLDDSLILCDCPGLVFPSFATTKAEMVVNGILPIDQLREHSGPSSLVAMRIPRHALESIYGIRIRTLNQEGVLDSSVRVRGEDLCSAYAVARGFKKAGQGNPDEARAARIILKDYVEGKLLYCQPPPTSSLDGPMFNADTYAGDEFFPAKKNPQTHETAQSTPKGYSSSSHTTVSALDDETHPAVEATQHASLDAQFFTATTSKSGVRIKGKFAPMGEFTRVKIAPHQVGAFASAGERIVIGGNNGGGGGGDGGKGKGKASRGVVLPTAMPGMGAFDSNATSKKHKKGKRGKVRVNWTADERGE